MLNSFRVRLILSLLLLLTLVQLATAISVLTATHKDNLLQQQKNLDIGAKVFGEVLSNRTIQLNQSLSVLSADFGFKKAIATGEQDTIASVLANHGARIGAHAFVLLSPQGKLLSSSLAGLKQEDAQALFEITSSNSTNLNILNLEQQSYQFVLQPVKAPTLIAWVGMGFLLDNQVAEQAKAITGIDISFIHQAADNTAIVSTLNEIDKQSVLAQGNALKVLLSHPSQTTPIDHLSMALSLDERHSQLWAVLHQSNSKWQQSYQHLRNNMLLIFAFTLTLAFVIATWLASSLSNPLSQLVHYARKIGQGTVPDPIRGAPTEVQALANSLDEMREDIEVREQDLIYQSQHDYLTGLLNRFRAKQLLSEQKTALTGTLVLLDIKHFRHINDIIGFANADALLILFSRRLETLTPRADVVARLDGDSFLLHYRQPIKAEQLHLILDNLEAPFSIEGSNISVTVRCGLLDIQANSLDMDALFRRADIALNQARTEELRIVSYRQGTDELYQRELSLIRDLPQGLTEQQLYLVFQPKVDLALNRCASAEALIRWQHPSLGFIPPDEFIRLAENSGNIGTVSQWVITQAITHLATWQRQGIKLKLAINLSAHDLMNEQLPEQIARQLQEQDLPSQALSIEVTEGAVMKDPQAVIKVLQAFRDMGISIAIDDFGTGQSSLAYLKMLPVDEVKIDRCFIKDISTDRQDAMIVDASIQLIHGLGMSVVAEGVEEQQGVDILRRLGCDTIQGYVFSKPLKAEDFISWINALNQTST
jgi:diguanylate cyclase (GGDEF)-like protein